MNKNLFIVVILLFLNLAILYKTSLPKTLKPLNSPRAQKLRRTGNDLKPSPSFTFSLPQLSYNSIFSSNHAWTTRLPQDKTITIITTGDVIPARTVNFKMTAYNNFQYPFEKTADFLKNADLTLINLEAPLINNCPVVNEGMIFCGNNRFIEGLKFADIDVVNLANNHTLNWGIEGINQTINLLSQNSILSSGFPNKKMAIKQVRGVKIGFFGFNLLDKFNENEIINIVKQNKENLDLLIVSFHWGAEYTQNPHTWQINLAHKIIDAGADLIAGNHPHWIQPIEIYNNKLIIYSHGNFIFDQEWSRETKIGIVAKHYFYENKLADSQFFPILISDFNQPEFINGEEKNQILNQLKTISYSKQ